MLSKSDNIHRFIDCKIPFTGLPGPTDLDSKKQKHIVLLLSVFMAMTAYNGEIVLEFKLNIALRKMLRLNSLQDLINEEDKLTTTAGTSNVCKSIRHV